MIGNFFFSVRLQLIKYRHDFLRTSLISQLKISTANRMLACCTKALKLEKLTKNKNKLSFIRKLLAWTTDIMKSHPLEENGIRSLR